MPASDKRSAHFVALVPPIFVMALGDAEYFDWSEVEAWAKEQLAGFTYLAHIDVAFYAKDMLNGFARIAWHVHAVIWSATRAEVGARMAAINAAHQAYVPCRPAALAEPKCQAKTLGWATRYTPKAPMKRYRLGRTERDGEERWFNNADALTRARGARVCKLLHGCTIDKLSFEGGAAMGMTEKIRKQTVLDIKRRDQRFAAQVARRLSGAVAERLEPTS